jgi:hypothetical protein
MTREILGEGEPSAEAAPAYPLRALVRADAEDYPTNRVRCGDLVFARKDPDNAGYRVQGRYESMYFMERELILDPTPEQIAEERAKLGLPSPAAQAAPEPSLGEGSKDELIKALQAARHDLVAVHGLVATDKPNAFADGYSEARSEGLDAHDAVEAALEDVRESRWTLDTSKTLALIDDALSRVGGT